jgi:hypothetical protein
MNQLETLDKDLPLREDIRLLGRILGDRNRRAHSADLDPFPSRRR